METKVIQNAAQYTVEIIGRVDTVSATELEKVLLPLMEDETPLLVLDCSKLEYVSSSGLRLFLMAHKRMAGKGGQLILRHVNHEVRSVLDLTGFSNFLKQEA